MATLAAKKLALYLLFADDPVSQRPVAGLSQVSTVYKGEQRPGDGIGPVWITIQTGKATATEIEFNVRIYGDPRSDPLGVQDMMDITVQEAWDVLESHSEYQFPGFEFGSHPDIDLLIASMKVTVGRDF